MGREASISYDQVAATAQALKLAGLKPTSRNVRERLGTGSMGTVHKHLQTWKAGRTGDTTAEDVSLPDSLQRAILHYVSIEVQASQAALRMELADQQHAAAELAIENERLHAALGEKDAAIVGLQAERATVQGRLDQLQSHATALQGELSKTRHQAETHHLEVAKLRQQVEFMTQLEEDLAAARTRMNTERHDRQTIEKQSAVLQARLTDALARADKAEAQLHLILTQGTDPAPTPAAVPRRRPGRAK